MAQNKKATQEVEKARPYLEGVAKSLVERLYGRAGPAWGTSFSELEDTVAAVRKVLTEGMRRQALDRQAAQPERPPAYGVCPGCGQPTPSADPPQPRRLETGADDAVWEEPKTRCQKCRRDVFPSEQESGN